MNNLPTPLYCTQFGKTYLGNALELMETIPDQSIDLVMTSPPFALQRQKEYGNLDQSEYVDWLLQFTGRLQRVLRDSGSFVIDLGGAYQKGSPIRSLYNFRVLLRMVDEQGWHLAEEFFWYNPAKLPSPIEWVNKRKIRAKDAVNTVWWMSRTEYPKADVTKVLVPYSKRMRKLLKDGEKYYTPKKRPSGHDISEGFNEDRGGAIPSNLLEIPNTASNSPYLRSCRLVGTGGNPARFPEGLPQFFIEFLTDTGDTVLDIFAGSNTTGMVAEGLGRNWIAFERIQKYLATSAFRFLQQSDNGETVELYQTLATGKPSGLNLSELAGINQLTLLTADKSQDALQAEDPAWRQANLM
jgi:DNA modification methylase